MNIEMHPHNLSAAGLARRSIATAMWLSVALSAPYQAASADELSDPFAHMTQVPEAELAELRGGFVTSDGLDIHFGVEQIVLVDGSVKTHTSLNLSTLQAGNGNQIDQNKLVNLLQNGDRNTVSSDVTEKFAAGLMTVIQNNLDAQTIQNLTVLNIGVSNVSGFNQRALGSAIDMGITGVLR